MSNAIQMPNRKLAEGMITAGIPFDKENGPCLNFYTPVFLRSKRIIGDNPVTPEAFERKVIETAEMGIHGNVVYFFERTREAENFIKEWDKTADTIRLHRQWDEFTDEEKSTQEQPPPLPNIGADIIAQVLCMHANNLKAIGDLPFINSPVCNTLAGKYVPGKTKRTSTGVPAGETSGAGKIWSTGLDNITRSAMKLHQKIKDWKGKQR